jgi:hypothetical protein
MILTHIAIDTSPDTRRVFQVPATYAYTKEDVLEHGHEVAARHGGVWQVQGTCTVHDARYLALLNNTRVMP